MHKGASGYEDASSSQEREIQSRSNWKIRELRAELEEAEQEGKVESAMEAKTRRQETRRQETRRRRARRQRTGAPGERQARPKKAAGEALDGGQ